MCRKYVYDGEYGSSKGCAGNMIGSTSGENAEKSKQAIFIYIYFSWPSHIDAYLLALLVASGPDGTDRGFGIGPLGPLTVCLNSTLGDILGGWFV